VAGARAALSDPRASWNQRSSSGPEGEKNEPGTVFPRSRSATELGMSATEPTDAGPLGEPASARDVERRAEFPARALALGVGGYSGPAGLLGFAPWKGNSSART